MILDAIPSIPPLASQVAASGDTTTTSTTDVVLAGMTLTPGAGDYLVWFSASMENTQKDIAQTYSLYVDGVQVPASERPRGIKNPGVPGVLAINALVVGVGAGQAIDVRWRVGGGTGTTHQRTLNLLKVG